MACRGETRGRLGFPLEQSGVGNPGCFLSLHYNRGLIDVRDAEVDRGNSQRFSRGRLSRLGRIMVSLNFRLIQDANLSSGAPAAAGREDVPVGVLCSRSSSAVSPIPPPGPSHTRVTAPSMRSRSHRGSQPRTVPILDGLLPAIIIVVVALAGRSLRASSRDVWDAETATALG